MLTRTIVLANRAPFGHDRSAGGEVRVRRSASGLVTALEPLVEACSGVWVAHGAGSADTLCVSDRSGLNVPPANPRYRLRYVWLDEREHRGYYYGFANEGLWPLCHLAHVQPIFRTDDFRMYQIANARFAAAACEEAGGGAPLVFVQDYHLALAPRMIRRRLPYSTVIAFWHIPWPHPRVLQTCPWSRDLLEGLLGADVAGFQTPEDCAHFLQSVELALHADIDRTGSRVYYRGRTTLVRPYPVGVEWDNACIKAAPAVPACREAVRRELGVPAGTRLGIGVDRLDYTKGIHEKFLAIERLFETHPELRGQFVFVQVAEPSRDCLPAYRTARATVVDACARINSRFGSEGFRPIVLKEAHHEAADVYRLYRAADLCYVGSLHDGMNLVAKEFVAARDDGRGVLVLSQFAGAARQLPSALLVNPYAVDDSAETLAAALRMPAAEQATRMRAMRTVVASSDVYWWGHQLQSDAMKLRSSSYQLPASSSQLTAS